MRIQNREKKHLNLYSLFNKLLEEEMNKLNLGTSGEQVGRSVQQKLKNVG